jgi:hypothetical protein
MLLPIDWAGLFPAVFALIIVGLIVALIVTLLMMIIKPLIRAVCAAFNRAVLRNENIKEIHDVCEKLGTGDEDENFSVYVLRFMGVDNTNSVDHCKRGAKENLSAVLEKVLHGLCTPQELVLVAKSLVLVCRNDVKRRVPATQDIEKHLKNRFGGGSSALLAAIKDRADWVFVGAVPCAAGSCTRREMLDIIRNEKVHKDCANEIGVRVGPFHAEVSCAVVTVSYVPSLSPWQAAKNSMFATVVSFDNAQPLHFVHSVSEPVGNIIDLAAPSLA